MTKRLSLLILLGFLTGCQMLPGYEQANAPENEADLLDSEQLMIPAGDEKLRRSVDAGTADDTSDLDESIDDSVKAEVERARDQLEHGPSQLDKEEMAAPRDLWDRLRPHLNMAVDLDNQRVKSQLNWYKSHPSYIDRTVARASRYLHHIVGEIEARDVPGEFALLPIVESAFDPFAYSHGRAAGLWQFIPSTGRIFDLNQNWWSDGRRDVIDSTAAALTYLDRLGAQFDDDWTLALASYNSGAGTVRKAIRYNVRRNRPTDYWNLRLPKETSDYVPKLLALAELVRNPEAHGIDLPSIPDEPYFEIVDTQSQIDLAQAAELAGVELEELYLLNPAFNRWATDPDGPHRLLIPVHKAEGFRQALAETPPQKRLSWASYKVVRGDSLIRIARQFNTTPGVIQQINKLQGNLIRVGQRLLIPEASKVDSTYTLSAGQRLASTQQRAAGKGKTKIEYRVKKGDSYWDISQQFGVNMRQLAQWNGKAPGDPLFPGQKLVIWTEGQSGSTALAANRSDMIKKIGYRVRSGDSLYVIASRYNVQVQDIMAWNDINPKRYLQPGDHLTLYVDITRSP